MKIKNSDLEYTAFNINSVFSLVAIVSSLKFLCIQKDEIGAVSKAHGKRFYPPKRIQWELYRNNRFLAAVLEA